MGEKSWISFLLSGFSFGLGSQRLRVELMSVVFPGPFHAEETGWDEEVEFPQTGFYLFIFPKVDKTVASGEKQTSGASGDTASPGLGSRAGAWVTGAAASDFVRKSFGMLGVGWGRIVHNVLLGSCRETSEKTLAVNLGLALLA